MNRNPLRADPFRTARRVALLLTLLAPLAPASAQRAERLPPPSTPAAPVRAETITWLDLLPENERDIAFQPAAPPAGHNFLDESGPAAVQEMSFTINPDIQNRLIRLPGFVVPLETDGEGLVTEFFLVPFFGACIHVPPPPPNQIVHVVPPRPFRLPSLTTPYWVTGPIKAGNTTSRLGASAYTVAASGLEVYTD